MVYRRLLRRVYRDDPALAELPFEQVENQYGPLCCLAAYQDRQLIDDEFRGCWAACTAPGTAAARSGARRRSSRPSSTSEKERAARHQRKLNELINELMHAFELPDEQVSADEQPSTSGFELLRGIEPHPALPAYLAAVRAGLAFAGRHRAAEPRADLRHRRGQARRRLPLRLPPPRRTSAGGKALAGPASTSGPRLERFAARSDLEHYVCKAVQVGPFKMLLVMHKSCFHLISDELRLFPQIEPVQPASGSTRLDWEGVLLFGCRPR